MNKRFILLCEFTGYLFVVAIIIFCFNIQNLHDYEQILSVLVIISVVACIFLMLLITEFCKVKKQQNNIPREVEMVEIVVYNPDATVDVGLYKSSRSDKK